MQITFDHTKDRIDTGKHGVSLGAAADFYISLRKANSREEKRYAET